MQKTENKKRKRNKWAASIMAAVISVSALSAADGVKANAYAGNGPKDAQEVQAFVDAFFKRPDIKKHLAGAAVAVVGDNKVLLNKGYGYADLEAKRPVNPDETIFRVASVSKSFTATAVMQLAEEGKLQLNDDVHAYTGQLKFANRTDAKLTIKELLTHTTGFDQTDNAPTTPLTLEQALKQFAPTVVRKPGTAYRYDNYASNLQGFIVQQIEGKPFEQVMDKRIFQPLGMNNSHFLLTDAVKEKLAVGYSASNTKLPDYNMNPIIAPGGGMLSTSTDISKFMLAQLNGGILGDQRILKEQTVQDMHKARIFTSPELPVMTYGFEMFFREHYNGETVIGKGGDLPGHHSWMWLLPDRKVGGFVVLNSDAGATYLIKELFAAFMDHYYPKKSSERPLLALTREQLKPYEGNYRHLRFPLAQFEVKAEDGYLLVSGASVPKKLFPIGDLLFRDENGHLAGFKKDDTGKVVYFDYLISAWSERVTTKADYADVPRSHPYANEIYALRALNGVYDPDKALFEPERPLTRAQFAVELLQLMDYPVNPEKTYFTDTRNHQYAAQIDKLAELGIVNAKANRFNPDRIMTREEAATMVYRAMQTLDSPPLPAKLNGTTSPWAQEAVQFIVAAGMTGPLVQTDENGTDYHSKDPLLHKEAALLLSRIGQVLVAMSGY
ncbi:serine hydrolase [Paenibacillus sp. GCM10027627]|uniref:serine hydrolase n=1 Tax=unclassified Paenibacillus TaxID=185978 RepID=UPI00362D383E